MFIPRTAVARAPARLDVMGGISDYAGGVCLEWPLRQATTCRLIPHEAPRVVARSASGFEPVSVDLECLNALDEAGLRARLVGSQQWALYVLGALPVLRREIGFEAGQGFALEIESEVPHGAGVASSAALEVAVLSALNRAFALNLDGHRIALLAQQVENRVVGVPCGVMDQLTSSLGRKDHLLRLKCQPDLVQGHSEPPVGIEFWGLDSGIKHRNGSGAYSVARCATWMGAALLAEQVPAALRGPDGRSYPANLTPDLWRALRPQIPQSLSGADFLRAHQHTDDVTEVEPDRVYRVRLAVEHPIYEADRVARFVALLEAIKANPAARQVLCRAAGELMVQSHFSYGHRCDLGSDATDLLVELAREKGPRGGIYGAKITGGGAGGTVALLCDRTRNPDLEGTLNDIAARYAERTGIQPTIFSGSSQGANVAAKERAKINL